MKSLVEKLARRDTLSSEERAALGEIMGAELPVRPAPTSCEKESVRVTAPC